jgi:predicted SAM-dependent methyltransferase
MRGALYIVDVRFERRRRVLADRYLAGDGVEIGALHRPLHVPGAARVRYVDRYDEAGLRRHYPELAAQPLVAVDVVDDGETLATLADVSVDFVIANHFIEHTQSPLATLRNHLRVLRPGGVLYLAVPDKRRTFDVDREVTSLSHVLRDLEEGPDWSRATHYREWAVHVDKAADAEGNAAKLLADDYSIHFHVWTPVAFGELLEHARDVLGMPFSIEELQGNGHEFIAILRRVANAGATAPGRASGAAPA